MSLTTAAIIPTRDRPDDLRRCLESLLTQTHLSDQVIVIDDGQIDEAALRGMFARTPIDFIYHRKLGQPGVARSRNLGVQLAQADIVFFFDDDVILEPEYIAETLAVYETDQAGEIGGVGGVITNAHLSLSVRLYELWRGHPLWGHGRVFPDGFNQGNYEAVRKVQPVEWLASGVCSYRRSVKLEYPFSEGFAGYETIEHCYHMRRKYRLLITPRARLAHMQSPASRLQPYEFGYRETVNLWCHFARNIPKRPVNRLAFAWMLVATILAESFALLLKPHHLLRILARLRGCLHGIWDCLVHRAYLNPTAAPREDLT